MHNTPPKTNRRATLGTHHTLGPHNHPAKAFTDWLPFTKGKKKPRMVSGHRAQSRSYGQNRKPDLSEPRAVPFPQYATDCFTSLENFSPSFGLVSPVSSEVQWRPREDTDLLTHMSGRRHQTQHWASCHQVRCTEKLQRPYRVFSNDMHLVFPLSTLHISVVHLSRWRSHH